MPTVFREGPYRFFFYAEIEMNQFIFMLERDESTVKFWITPVRLHRSKGFRRYEISLIRKIIEEKEENIKRFCGETIPSGE